MQRRNFIRLLGGAAVAWPLAARAQQRDRVRRIGVLMASTADDPEWQARFAAFQQRLQQLGWSDGRTVHIDTRWATTKPDDIRRYAAELVALAPDVIVLVLAPRPWRRCDRRPAPCQSCSRRSPIRSAPATSKA